MTDPDDPMLEAMQALEPSPDRVRAMRGCVLEAYEADHTSLVAEWIGLLRVRPLAHGGWLLAATVVLLAQIAPWVAQILG